MSDPSERLSLNVVGPIRPPRQGEALPAGVVLSEPMLRYRCNQKGCCCSGWEIPFRLEDFLRLHEHIPEAERGSLTKDIQLVVDAESKGANGESILHSVKLGGVGEDDACRFLEGGGGCSVHRRYGLLALPDLCVDFPGFPYKRPDGLVELFFDPVCPSVIDQLAESDAPLRLHRRKERFDDPGLDLRVTHASAPIGGRVGRQGLDFPALELLRDACVEELAQPRPIYRTLASLLDAFSRLDPLVPDGGPFAPREVDPAPFLRFLFACIGAHGPEALSSKLVNYRRFIHVMDPAPLLKDRQALERHLVAWQPAFEKWLAPQDELLRPLQARWLAHRFGTPMSKGRGELRRAADAIVHVFATSLRYAAALGATLGRPVDRELYRVAIGVSEYFYRSVLLPRDSLPWFASQGVAFELGEALEPAVPPNPAR